MASVLLLLLYKQCLPRRSAGVILVVTADVALAVEIAATLQKSSILLSKIGKHIQILAAKHIFFNPQ